jgi:hypothetical protein
MALINIPTKAFDGSLSAAEFNQFLEALKDGTRDINTAGLSATSASLTNATISGTLTVQGESGPFAKFYELDNIIYVSKSGGTYNGTTFDGKSPGKALSSFQNAINNAATILGSTPSRFNSVSIVCLDGGTYEESIICIDHVHIYAPNATLKLGGTGSKQLVFANNNVFFNLIYRDTGANKMVLSNAAAEQGCFLNCNSIVDNGTGAAISTASEHIFSINCNAVVVNGSGVGITNEVGTPQHYHVNLKEILLNSNFSKGIYFTEPGEMHGDIDGVYYENPAITDTTAIHMTAGEISMVINKIKGDVALDISGGATLRIFCNKLIGTQTNSGGTIAVVTPEVIQDTIDTISSKEDDLGNPAADGYVLISTAGGVRSWISVPGDMLKSTYDPSNKNSSAFAHENHSGDYIDLDASPGAVTSVEGRLSWNADEHTLNIHTGVGDTVIQTGQEQVIKVHNANLYPLANGKVIYYTGTNTGGVPNVDLIKADAHENLFKGIAVVTGTILSGENGFVTVIGKVRDIDTSAFSVGPVYVSSISVGEFTNTPPEFPSYRIRVGHITNVSPTEGVLLVSICGTPYDTIANFWNGTIKEEFNFGVSSDGSTITGSLSSAIGGDLTAFFSSGMFTVDVTPAATLTLTPGTDTIPVKNYIYIPQDTKVLTKSTAGFPSSEHIRIADIVLQSAATVQTYGALHLRNWNDSIEGDYKTGENAHIGQWIRNRPASWHSGIEGSITVVGLNGVYFSCGSGFVFQKHLHAFSAINCQAGDLVRFVNHPSTPYLASTNISSVLVNSLGGSLSGRYYSIVVWGVNLKDGLGTDKIMVNLPSGSYGNLNDAINDISNFDSYQFPSAYNGTAFLIARFVLRHTTADGGTWTLQRTEDLRGVVPTVGGGGIPVAGVSTFSALTDTPSSYTGNAYDIVRVNAGESGLEFVNGVSGSFTTTDGKTVTVTYGVITNIA